MMRQSAPLLFVMIILVSGISLAAAQENVFRNEINTAVIEEITIEDFSWLAGHWRGEAAGSVMDEFWTPPVAGAMQCIFRMYNSEGVGFYQFIVLGEQDGEFMLRLKHFTNELKGVEEKDQTLDYVLLDRGPSIFYFDKLTMEQNSEDEFTVYVKAGEGEESAVVTLKYFKVK